MRAYEVVFVFRSEDENYQKGKSQVKEELERVQATILKEEDMGVRELAYPVKKETSGHYLLIETEMDPDKISEVSSEFRLLEPVLKFLFVKKE